MSHRHSQRRDRHKHKKIQKASKKKTQSRHYGHDKYSRRRQQRDYSDSSSSSSSSSYSSSSSSSSSRSDSESVSSSTAKRRKTPHFRFKVGEKIGHKYRLTRLFGDGTFGRVVEGKYKDNYYAIKIIKPVQKYIESARTEKSIIKRINEEDSRDQYQIVRYVQSFYHYEFYCIVFKPLGKSLYDLIKKNKHQGFPIKMVQSFFRQILKSIGFMHRIGYTHTDLKPENILLESEELEKANHPKLEKYFLPVNDKIRIIDFGGATHRDEKHSSIINTRQYRSPEVILECEKWSEISDVWSIGCIIAQLFTGELLFETHEDHEHLTMIEKNSGKFPLWMMNRCQNNLKKMFRDGQIYQHEVGKFVDHWENIVGMKTIRQIFSEHPELINLLGRCLQIDPHQRISCSEALRHSFFSVEYG